MGSQTSTYEDELNTANKTELQRLSWCELWRVWCDHQVDVLALPHQSVAVICTFLLSLLNRNIDVERARSDFPRSESCAWLRKLLLKADTGKSSRPDQFRFVRTSLFPLYISANTGFRFSTAPGRLIHITFNIWPGLMYRCWHVFTSLLL